MVGGCVSWMRGPCMLACLTLAGQQQEARKHMAHGTAATQWALHPAQAHMCSTMLSHSSAGTASAQPSATHKSSSASLRSAFLAMHWKAASTLMSSLAEVSKWGMLPLAVHHCLAFLSVTWVNWGGGGGGEEGGGVGVGV